MTQDELISQLAQMRDEARRLGDSAAVDALAHAIDCAAKGKLPAMQKWIERAIASMRRSEEG